MFPSPTTSPIAETAGRRRFFCDDDRHYYLALLAEQAAKHKLNIWSYCLMTNHVHLLVVPQREDSMAQAMGTRTCVI